MVKRGSYHQQISWHITINFWNIESHLLFDNFLKLGRFYFHHFISIKLTQGNFLIMMIQVDLALVSRFNNYPHNIGSFIIFSSNILFLFYFTKFPTVVQLLSFKGLHVVWIGNDRHKIDNKILWSDRWIKIFRKFLNYLFKLLLHFLCNYRTHRQNLLIFPFTIEKNNSSLNIIHQAANSLHYFFLFFKVIQHIHFFKNNYLVLVDRVINNVRVINEMPCAA
jgi:hypothetical protein